jgi:hypothetical protein
VDAAGTQGQRSVGEFTPTCLEIYQKFPSGGEQTGEWTIAPAPDEEK